MSLQAEGKEYLCTAVGLSQSNAETLNCDFNPQVPCAQSMRITSERVGTNILFLTLDPWSLCVTLLSLSVCCNWWLCAGRRAAPGQSVGPAGAGSSWRAPPGKSMGPAGAGSGRQSPSPTPPVVTAVLAMESCDSSSPAGPVSLTVLGTPLPLDLRPPLFAVVVTRI